MPFSADEVIKALHKARFRKTDQTGSHVKMEFVDKNTGERRVVTVPLHGEIQTGTLRKIAEQAGAEDFQKFK